MAFASISSIPFPKAGRTRNIVQLGAFQELAFSSFSVFGFLVMMGYFIPMIYVPAYAVQKLGLPTDTGMYLLAGLNAGSGVGRLAGPLFAMRVGPANLLLGATVVCGILVFLWIPVTSIASLAVVSVLFGIFCGAMIAIIPLVAVHPLISPHPDVIGTRMGMVWFVASIGILIGAPIAGALKSSSSHSFLGLQVFAGAVIMGSVVFISITLTLIRRHRR
jgi:predicted MFS family arabinose efflux permease